MQSLSNKTILITGGTGSFGKTMLQRVVDTDCKEIRIFSRDELKQDLMRNEYTNPKVKFHIGDVRDIESVDRVMAGVNLVFHAAALKQVPSCEFFPMQAVMTNILGSNIVINSAIKHNVEKLVCLSTDKAVYPINSMGMTKAIMEKLAKAAAMSLTAGDTVVSSVRYGNVMYSRGSVIPLFIKQIKEHHPITVTEPSMTRFLLALPHAIDLVLFAFEHSDQGDTFIKKAPACTIMDLAVAIKDLFKSEVPIKNIGIRHSEKIFETLATTEELRHSEDMGEYFRVRMDSRDLNYNIYFSEGKVDAASTDDYTSHNTTRLDVAQVQELLLSLPEVATEIQRYREGTDDEKTQGNDDRGDEAGDN